MGVDPVSSIVVIGGIAVVSYLAYLQECEREKERLRRQKEDSRRWRREARRKEKERLEQARREEESEEEIEDESEEDSEDERERRRNGIRRRRRNTVSDYNYRMNSTSEYYRSPPYYDRFEREPIFSTYGRYSPEEEYYRSPPYDYRFEREPYFSTYGRYSPEQHRNSRCEISTPELEPSTTENSNVFNPFECKKNSVKVTIKPPQTTQDKNQNAKNQGSNNRPSSSQGASTSNSSGNASKQNTKSAPKASTSGSQQPQRNNNNNDKNNKPQRNNNNDNNKQGPVQDNGKLNAFIKKLNAVLNLCNASAELRDKILSFFKKFEKHEENFLRLVEDFTIQNIAIEDILSIVIKLFQSDYFAKDVAYENFIALMEFVAKYLADERFIEMVEDGLRGNNKPFDQQRAECMNKVLQRKNIFIAIMDLFKKYQKEIVEDNTNQPLEPDFSGIFTKVYHYFKHKDVREKGKKKEWTVTEYFDRIRELLTLLIGLTPEYVELTDVNNPRREIVFEVYSEAVGGYFHIVVRAYGSILKICTFFLKERYDKKAKDGDKRVDGKKKP